MKAGTTVSPYTAQASPNLEGPFSKAVGIAIGVGAAYAWNLSVRAEAIEERPEAADGVLDFLITLGMLEGADAIRRLKILLDGSRV